MSGLLDNLEKNNYSDGDEDDHINRLFPKCKPRASSLQPTSTTTNNATTGNADDSLSSGSRTSLSGCSSLTNNHKNINTLKNNNNLYEDRYDDEEDDEENDTQIIRNGAEVDYDEDNNIGFRCLSSSRRATRASFVENNSNSSFVEKGHRTTTTTTTTASSALAYPGKATRANNPTASYKSANSRSARTRRSHHHHHHNLQQQQSNIEFGKDESSAGLHHISTLPSVALHKASSVKRNSCNQGRIMECNTLGDHFDNGVESGGSGSSGASALSHSSSFSLAAEKNVGNVGLSSSSGLGSSSASSGGSSAGNAGIRDSRIEIAGGREIFSQNRIKAGRRVRGSSSMESMVVAQQQQEQTTAGAGSLASLAGNNSGSSLHHNQQQTYHHQESPPSGPAKGRRKSSSNTTNPLISPTSPVASYNNIWEPHHPVANKKNFPFSSSSSSSSRGGGESRDRRCSATASRHAGNGSHGYLRNSKSSHSHQSLYYPYHGRENPESKKSPSLDGFDIMMGSKNPFPQVHQSPPSLKSPTGGLMMKETVFASEITSIEKPLVVEGAEAVGGGNKPKPSFIYETPIGSGGEIVFDDIEDLRWHREQQRRTQLEHEADGTFASPCGSVGGVNMEKSPLSLSQNMKSDDGGDDDEESDSPVTQQQQQYQHRRMLHHHHHHYSQQQHSVPADAGIPRGPTSPFSNPTGYESDECASSSVLADNNSRTSPYNGNKRLIGNIPIAEYEGSPKRYGLRLPTEAKPSHLEIIDPNSPTITHLSVTSAAAPPPPQLSPRLQSPSSNFATTRLPGFPHRVVDTSQQQPQLMNNIAPASTVKPVLSESPTTATSECIIMGERRESEGGGGNKSDDIIMSTHVRSDGGGLSGRNSPVVGNAVNPAVPLSSSATASSGPGKMFGIGTTTDTSPDDSIASQQGSNNTATNSSEDPEAELSGHAGALNRCDLSGLEEEDNYLLYEFSETRKVLDEFFKPPDEDGRLIGFDDLDYTLRRQAGNSYVGQRLAAVEASSELGVEESPKKPLPPRRNVQLNISSGGGASPKLISFQEVLPVSAHHSSHNNNKSQSSVSPSSMVMAQGNNVPSNLLDPSARDVNDNDIEIETASTNTETDLGDTEVGLQVGHSRNFTLSPETTDCDSNELESEISLDFEASLHSSSRIGATMPVLEDGLSSGNVSDNEDRDQDEMFERSTRTLPLASRKLNSSKMLLPSSSSSCTAAAPGTVPNCAPTESNPTLLLMKKQITEIEKEIQLRSQRGVHAESNGAAALSANGGPCPSSNIPESSPSSAGGLLGTCKGGNNPRMTKQMDMNSASEFAAAGSRGEPYMFDCNDPELEALDPMRPTPPPSPAPSSVPHNMQAASSMQHGLQSSASLSSQPQIPIPGRMVSYTSSNTSSGTRSANNDGINICSSNSNAPTHSSSSGSLGHCASMAGGPSNVNSVGGTGGGGTVGGSLNNSGLGLSHSSADMILSGDSGVVSSSSASSDIHGIKDVTAGFPKSMSSQRSSAGGALDHHPTSSSTTTNVSMSSPPSQQHSEPSQHNIPPEERLVSCPRDTSPVWVPRHPVNTSGNNPSHRSVNASVRDPLLGKQRYEEVPDDDADTDQETDRLLGQNRTDDDYGFYDDKEWKKVKSRSILPSMGKGVVSSIKCAAAAAASTTPAQQAAAVASAAAQLLNSTTTSSIASSGNSSNHTVSQKSLVSPQQQQQQQQQPPQQQQQQVQSPTSDSINQFHDPSSSVLPILPANSSSNAITSSNTSVPSKSKKEKDGVKKKRSKEELVKNPAVLIEGVLFRARYLGSTQLVCEGQPTKATRMMQAEEAVSRIKAQANHNGNVCQLSSPPSSTSPTSVERGNNALLKDAMSPFNSMKQQQQLQQLQQSDGANQFLYSNPRQPETTTVQDDEDDGDSDMGSAGDEEDDYFNDKPNLVSATLGGSIVDTNALVGGGTNEASPVIAGGRGLSASTSDELTVAAVATSGLSVAGGMTPAGSSLGGSVPHLSPPYGSALPGTMFRLRFVGSLEVEEEVGTGRRRRKRPKKAMVEEVVTKLKTLAPEGETQPSTEVDLFISTEKIMVLNTDLKEIMMDHALRTISYIADIGDLVVLMARRRPVPSDTTDDSKMPRPPKMICHVFESDEAQYIAQSIGQAFQVAYMEFLKANGIEDHSFVREMDYQEVLNSQEIFGDELQMFAKKELQKEVVVPKAKGEILGVVIVESGWGSMLPTVVIANLAPAGAAARCGQLNIGDQIIAINGVSLVGLPLSTCQNYIKNTKAQTVVKLTVVPCPPVVEVKIKRPDTKYQLGFSVQNGVICSLLRGGIAERGGVRVGHRIIEINNQSVVAVPHEKIVNLLATSVGEINMKTMPTSMFRLLTGQETPLYI